MHNQTHSFTKNDFLKWFEAKTNEPLDQFIVTQNQSILLSSIVALSICL